MKNGLNINLRENIIIDEIKVWKKKIIEYSKLLGKHPSQFII